MIDRLAELNRVIFAATEVKGPDNRADLKVVIQQCESTVIEGRMPDHGKSIVFGERLGLLKREGSAIKITDTGQDFIDLNPDGLYDLSEKQKRFVLSTCFLHGILREDTRRLFEGFSPSYSRDTFSWSKIDSPSLQVEWWTIEHLIQLELLVRTEEGLHVAVDYVKTVAAFLDEGEGWSEEKFQKYFQEKLEVGNFAEELVLNFERTRLHELGHDVESLCVRSISKLKVNAGYDIESFDISSPTINYDRFIEVKGARSSSVHFFWSQNEMKVAKKLRGKYWIYFQGGLDIKKRIAKNKPLLFRDPFNILLKDDNFTKTPQGIIVTTSFQGEVIITN